jgi:hypothetical protein
MVSFEQAAGGWFQAKVDEINRKNFAALKNNMQDGEEITQTFIATRGTEKSGKQGRVDTGAMLDAVDSDVKLQSKDEAIGRFGWLKKKPTYAQYQEEGTKYIAPMYALSDAAEIVKLQLIKDISDNVKEA